MIYGILAIILCIANFGTAGASIISRDFFDEALKNYALKSDVGDFSSLQSKIGILPTGTIQWGDSDDYNGLGGGDDGLDACPKKNIALPEDIGGLLSLVYSSEKGAPSILNLLDIILNGTTYCGCELDGLIELQSRIESMSVELAQYFLPINSENGQYVLTAKKNGDEITYTWVKMDLTNEEQNE